MSFTKIAAAGIGSTETVTLHSLEVLNNATIGGVLTYEDVTNVDSIGIITARAGVLVGSGITLSKDGDVFFTGIATGNGSGLTALNASNLGSGTVPTARLGSGTASSSTFLRGDSTFAAVTSTTINTNADNRVITGSGTANTLNGEASLTFDGTKLNVGGTGVSQTRTVNIGSDSEANLAIETHNTSASETANIRFYRSRGTAASPTTLVDNDVISNLLFYGHDGTDYANAAGMIRVECDGTVAGNQMPGAMSFHTNGGSTSATERLRISSDGKVGINIAGTDNTTPVRNLDIADASGAILRLISSDDSLGANERVGEIEFYTNDDDAAHVSSNIKAIADGSDAYGRRGTLTFGTRSDSGDASEKMRLTHNGQILMGGTSAYATFENSSTNPRLQVRGTDLNGSCQAWIRATSDAGAPKLFLGNTRSTSEGGHTVVQAGDELGQIHFAGSDGSQFVNGASIAGVVRPGTTPASDNVPGDLTFAVNHGSTGTTEQARISRGGNGGRFMINHNDTGTYNAHLSVRQNSAGPYPIGAIGQTTNQGLIGFFDGSGGIVGSIGKSGSNVTFNTSSDYRLKENAVSISDGITRLKSLKPYKFNFIDDSSTTLDGFFAHEVSSVVPEAVTGDKDGIITQEYIDEGKELQAHLGKPIIQSLDHSKLVPLLTAALQEAIVKIETLEAEVAALKG